MIELTAKRFPSMKPTPLHNAAYFDQTYRRWRTDPSSVSADWRFFFEGFELGVSGSDPRQSLKQAKVHALMARYREIGHLLACMDPLHECPISHPLLELQAFGLDAADMDAVFLTGRDGGQETASLKQIITGMREAYCRSVGVEYTHLQDPDERAWLERRLEGPDSHWAPSREGRRRILEKLIQASRFELFLSKKYVAVTRFSLEGAEVLIGVLDALADRAAEAGGRELVLGMAHRGRLNVQAHFLEKPYADIFAEFEHCYDPDILVGSGDVKYHAGYLNDVVSAGGKPLRIVLLNNPSHLEAVSPVVEGLARGRQDIFTDQGPGAVWPLLIHGDAAFAGQGVVAETLNMSQLEGYRTGGTLHIVINNQIGFTTLPQDARSTRYATDIAKMLMVPIFHVHGEDPDAALRVAHLAADYRAAFAKDVVIDLICYRRWGHNEGDEPYFTQPLMVERIRSRPSLDHIYAQRLVAAGIVDTGWVEETTEKTDRQLTTAFDEIHGSVCAFPQSRFFENWQPFHGRLDHDPPAAGPEAELLRQAARGLSTIPSSVALNPKIKNILARRLAAVETGSGIDWANAEALAFASLLMQQVPIRLSGQDVARGTFSQRHSTVVDTHSGTAFCPLNHLDHAQARFDVFNSLLSEAAVLGFEYGYALARPEALVIWEAQFGDFANNAQAVIDLFIASGEAKWQRLNHLVLLLPHGAEGMGPEHTSARPERFLQLCAGNNMAVCQPTTPAQYFHLLRGQVVGAMRKPLVILTPKSLLRHPAAVSALADLADGGFTPVIDDAKAFAKAGRVLACSGKIYYELAQRRQDLKVRNTAIVRLERLYPFPDQHLGRLARRFGPKARWLWVQDEPQNMGAWEFVRPRIEAVVDRPLTYVGREASPTPATGFPAIFKRQQAAIMAEALGI
jgi:2-oxoglutarate dehydrogenase E1 component